jgi:hypothetical protein
MASSDALDHPSICVDIKARSKVGASYSRDSPRKQVMKGGDERRVVGRRGICSCISSSGSLYPRGLCFLDPLTSVYMYNIKYNEYDRRYPYNTIN